MVGNAKPGSRRDPGFELGVDRLVEIEDRSTDRAGEMMMPIQARVEPAARAGLDLLDQTQATEQPEVPVHGAQAHARAAAPHGGVNPFRRRVPLGAPDHAEDDLPGGRQPQSVPREIPLRACPPARPCAGPRSVGVLGPVRPVVASGASVSHQ
jgi:hypothetical protein